MGKHLGNLVFLWLLCKCHLQCKYLSSSFLSISHDTIVCLFSSSSLNYNFNATKESFKFHGIIRSLLVYLKLKENSAKNHQGAPEPRYNTASPLFLRKRVCLSASTRWVCAFFLVLPPRLVLKMILTFFYSSLHHTCSTSAGRKRIAFHQLQTLIYARMKQKF